MVIFRKLDITSRRELARRDVVRRHPLAPAWMTSVDAWHPLVEAEWLVGHGIARSVRALRRTRARREAG
ncbi:hypothetical protein C7C45_29370 [Micromonospora arborensis]|uniref:Uncharacterized protein n=1 Tax=Micromonospora arborensis TaxID=2116518 RepID=A0A318NB93_9ACTN|nr:hypothetical protein C7C45_29370 [Micromonospora arborensis]